MSLSRRQFLGAGAAVTAATAVAPGIRLVELALARNPEEAATAAQRWGLLIDTTKCADDCSACVDACVEEHDLWGFAREQTDPQWIRIVELVDRQTGHKQRLPVMCQHCEHPPCVDVCPTGASMKRADGIVLVDRHVCIGCRYCMMACPYKARSFVHESLPFKKEYNPRGKGCVESCTLCYHRVDAGEGTTACAEACKKAGHEALLFGDLKDPESEIAKRMKAERTTQLRADLGLNTGVRYTGL
ncbi:MAG: 4Fe-4S ferredoxin [Gammaproteobacteria bacterium SG8_47]|nr:MAG: 4Fe-4S ferredoxin [Gammaproteobacteria bacterium SG8_47]